MSIDLPKYVDALAGLMPGRDLTQFVDTLNLTGFVDCSRRDG